MGLHVYKIKKISSDEYHVLEYVYGLDAGSPFVIAKCSGPVPANDVLVSLSITQELKYHSDKIRDAQNLLKSDVLEKINNLETVIRKYSCVNENE